MPFLLLMLGLVLAACRGDGGADFDPEGPAGAPAVYERRLLFLAPDEEPHLGALFDFSTVPAGTALRRSARGWLHLEDGWRELLDLAWEMEPMREPWRLVPHGPLRLVVGDDDDIEAVVHRTESNLLRLITGQDAAGWVPHAEGQLRLRGSRLHVDGHEADGMVLDLQLVHRGEGDQLGRPGGREAFLADGLGMYLVVADTRATAPFAWMRRGHEEETWREASIEVIESRVLQDGDEGGGLDVPTGWRLFSREGGLYGEIQPIADRIRRADADTSAGLVRVHAVRGWVDVLGERRQVVGIVRHARE